MVEHSNRKPATLPCIVCGEELKNAQGMDRPPVNHPVSATVFQAPGQYGSGVFDPMDGSTLEINICDGCLSKAAKRSRVIHNITANTHYNKSAKSRYWNGGDE